jgi:hypothetical protein
MAPPTSPWFTAPRQATPGKIRLRWWPRDHGWLVEELRCTILGAAAIIVNNNAAADPPTFTAMARGAKGLFLAPKSGRLAVRMPEVMASAGAQVVEISAFATPRKLGAFRCTVSVAARCV